MPIEFEKSSKNSNELTNNSLIGLQETDSNIL